MARGRLIGCIAFSMALCGQSAAGEERGGNSAVLRASIARQMERLSALSAQAVGSGQSAESLHASGSALATALGEAPIEAPRRLDKRRGGGRGGSGSYYSNPSPEHDPNAIGGGLIVMGGGGNVGEHGAGTRAGFGHISAPLKGGAGRIGGSFGYGVTYVGKESLGGGYSAYRARIREFGGLHYQTPEVGNRLRLEAGVRPVQVKYPDRTSAGTIPYVALATRHWGDGGAGIGLRLEWGFVRTGIPGVGGQRVMAGISLGVR